MCQILHALRAHARLWIVLAFLAPGAALAVDTDPFYQNNFAFPEQIVDWQISAGTWQITNNRFVSSAGGAADIATVPVYDPGNFDFPTMDNDFALDVYAAIQSGTAQARVGAVYNFADPGNYYEVTITATGNAQLRSVVGGVASTIASATFTGPGTNKWIHVYLLRTGDRTTVEIDGVAVFVNVPQAGLPEGDIGLITRNARAQFDDIEARAFSLVRPYLENFNDLVANRWTVRSGNWSAASGAYTNSSVAATTVTLSPLAEMNHFGQQTIPVSYTFKARMLNPYGGSGNLVGVVLYRDAQNYNEIVFSPRGEARMNEVKNGVRTTLATAAYSGGGPNKSFDVEVTSLGFVDSSGYVRVNGATVFDTLPGSDLRDGSIGLITHWSPARFDDVRAVGGFIFRPFLASFDDATHPLFLTYGSTWRIESGALHSFGIGQTETALLDKPHELANIDYRLRMVNHYGASGNLVGLTFGHRRLGDDYYEVVFSPSGVARLNRVRKGVTTTLATAQYSGGGPHSWFEVQLLERGQDVTVAVNGATVFNGVHLADLGKYRVGIVTHWADAEFDDISLTEVP